MTILGIIAVILLLAFMLKSGDGRKFEIGCSIAGLAILLIGLLLVAALFTLSPA